MNWKPFYFDSNETSGLVDSPELWARMKVRLMRAWWDDMATVEKGLADVREYVAKTPMRAPLFTLFKDGDGQTLKEFFDANGMKWEA